MAKLDAYLTVKEAAEYLGVSPNTLRNWGKEGKVPIHRNPINNYRLFKIADLDALVKKIDKTAKRKSVDTRRSKPR